jgi:hypothetical protein
MKVLGPLVSFLIVNVVASVANIYPIYGTGTKSTYRTSKQELRVSPCDNFPNNCTFEAFSGLLCARSSFFKRDFSLSMAMNIVSRRM